MIIDLSTDTTRVFYAGRTNDLPNALFLKAGLIPYDRGTSLRKPESGQSLLGSRRSRSPESTSTLLTFRHNIINFPPSDMSPFHHHPPESLTLSFRK